MEKEDLLTVGFVSLLGLLTLFSVGVLSYRTGRNIERKELTQSLKDQTQAIMEDGYKLCVDDEKQVNQSWYDTSTSSRNRHFNTSV